ncbi:hypothetical protein MLD38_002208 [Melastoma candidum]|uniref:Uncharacterized protein n=1 Tax=Melastoma candidum TaxID=119954 RepID=A0ACB9SHQ6_9MYRT|nr:hypothetical protein MLD38_002208 [Melastoma candidum]
MGITSLIVGDTSGLSFGYYHKSCPNFESIVNQKVNQWVKQDPTLAPSLMRLHFHDCAVRGCDASILLNHTGSERSAAASKTLRGFDLIDDIKAALEKACPRTVSCADILTSAARDATVAAGGPFWMVPYGRRDGWVSIAAETRNVPMGYENMDKLIEFFQSRGLNILDLVVLSGILFLERYCRLFLKIVVALIWQRPSDAGAHTIGRCTCGSIQERIYYYNGTNKPDPSVNPGYLNFLRRKCRWASEEIYLDASTPQTFDSVYYNNLQKKMGLLHTDQLLYSDVRTNPIVTAFVSEPFLFYQQFSVSMAKLGNIDVLTGNEGEVRTNCNRR